MACTESSLVPHPPLSRMTADHHGVGGPVTRPVGKIKLYCKGADNVIFERLAPNQLFRAETEAHLELLAAEGLRTLCLAMTQLEPAAYEEWNKQYKIASTTLVNRAAEVRLPPVRPHTPPIVQSHRKGGIHGLDHAGTTGDEAVCVCAW
jgi:magnesium-transporting ATPase (P-type)